MQQEPALFQGTIGYNLRYFKKEATKEEINKALETAHATKVVYGKEDDPDTCLSKHELAEMEKKEVKVDTAGHEEEGKDDKAKCGLDREVGLKGGQLSGG